MSTDDAQRLLSGSRLDAAIDLRVVRRCQMARDAVDRRAPGFDQTDLASAAPSSLAPHLAALKAHPAAAPYFDEGFQIKVVDISRLIAYQPTVAEDAAQRVSPSVADDEMSLAQVTLPISSPEDIQASFDASRHIWTIGSPNPNLRVVGHFAGPTGPDSPPLFGFPVAILPSFVSVALYQGRYFLRDGYHRSYGLLKHGIIHAPALVREFSSFEEIGIAAGMLPHDAYLGDRPPLVRDFLDDAVAADVEIPVTRKVVAVQALELTTVA